jgi:hypothetical protein
MELRPACGVLDDGEAVQADKSDDAKEADEH